MSGDATQGKGRTLIALPGHSGDQNKLEISHKILTSCHKRAISLTGLNTHAGVNYFEFIRRISVKSYIFHIDIIFSTWMGKENAQVWVVHAINVR